MSERAKYSRVYWSVIDDPKFAAVYDNDAHLAAWLRCLLVADQSHPASAHIPAGCRRGSIKALADAGLIDLVGGRFRVHGLDAERTRRASFGSHKPPERDPNGSTGLGQGLEPEGLHDLSGENGVRPPDAVLTR